MAEAARTLNVDPQTGFAPIVWDAWNTNWGGTEVIQSTRTRTENNSTTFGRGGWINGGSGTAHGFKEQQLEQFKKKLEKQFRMELNLEMV